MTLNEYKKEIEEESIHQYRLSARIDIILADAGKELTEPELDELWNFADNHKGGV